MTERTLRFAVAGTVVVGVAAFIGFGMLLARLGREGTEARATVASDADVRAVRGQLSRLTGSIDSIRRDESRLRATVAPPPAGTPSLWTGILRRAVGRTSWASAASVVTTTDADSTARELLSVARRADSLIARAGGMQSRLATLADSVGARRNDAGSAELSPTAQWISASLSRGVVGEGIRVAREGDVLAISAPPGTLLLAPAAGRVVRVALGSDGVSQLILEHDAGYRTVYDNWGAVLVREGERVARNQILARTARTSGASLRFEVRRGAQRVAPTVALADGTR